MKGFTTCCLLFILKSALSCGDTSPSLDFFEDEEQVSSPRLRREVTLNERMLCQPGDPQPPTRVDTRQRVNDLVSEMTKRNLDAYIVPSQDAHQSEYVADADMRRHFVSGFAGSAGTAVVLSAGQRALWTDGRYFLEADHQLDCDWLLMKSRQEGVPTMMEWLTEQLSSGSRVGIDPTLVAAPTYLNYQKKLNESKLELVPEITNLVDQIWTEPDRPARKEDQIYVLEQEYAGRSWTEKVKDVREKMMEEKVDLLVVTALDEIAWLLNLRGHDIPYNPVFHSYLIMDMEKVTFFINSNRISPNVDFHLSIGMCMHDICFEKFGYDNMLPMLSTMAKSSSVTKVLLPKKYAYSGGVSYAVYSAVPPEKRKLAVSPILNLKAMKNQVEFEGMKKAHLKDAVALIDFLALLEREVQEGVHWDEMKSSATLTRFRSEQPDYVSPSFETISAYGPNGAIIHYRPTADTNRTIGTDSLYLLDSGGQYKDGTTDVTRTLHFGTPTPLQVETYTRVLMGAIDLAMLVFPKGTGDAGVDVLARRYLYQVGLDYLHGTGHGIGMFLNIHESPTQLRINSKENHKFELGQFFSDEPGYYKTDHFGIRLETILAVVRAPTKYDEGKEFYAFEPITLVPFEPKLIDLKLLNGAQCKYLNLYHARVRDIVGEELSQQGRMDALRYVRQRTEPFSCPKSGLASGALATQATSVKKGAMGSAPTSLGTVDQPSPQLGVSVLLLNVLLVFMHQFV